MRLLQLRSKRRSVELFTSQEIHRRRWKRLADMVHSARVSLSSHVIIPQYPSDSIIRCLLLYNHSSRATSRFLHKISGKSWKRSVVRNIFIRGGEVCAHQYDFFIENIAIKPRPAAFKQTSGRKGKAWHNRLAGLCYSCFVSRYVAHTKIATEFKISWGYGSKGWDSLMNLTQRLELGHRQRSKIQNLLRCVYGKFSHS